MINFGTSVCGKHFNTELSDSEKKEAIFESYIDKYGVDMSIYNYTDYRDYKSVNNWFSRHLKMDVPNERSVRPIARPSDDNVTDNIIVSPADCRLVVFQNVIHFCLLPFCFSFFQMELENNHNS